MTEHAPDSRASFSEGSPRSELARLLARVTRPGRYTGGEFNVRHKPGARPRIVLSYPDVYEIGISNPGLQILYSVLNDETPAAAERAYCPWPDMAGAHARRRRAPLDAREHGAGRRLRPVGLHAAARAHLHQRPRDARPGGRAAARRRARGGGPHRARRRARGGRPVAAGAVLRRLLRRRGRAPARGDRRGAGGAGPLGAPAARSPRSPASGCPACTRGPGPASGVHGVLEHAAGAAAGRARARGGARSRRRRGHARLHRRLPLLPGRHVVPAGARAAGRPRGGGRRQAARRDRLRRGLAAVAELLRLQRRRRRRSRASAACGRACASPCRRCASTRPPRTSARFAAGQRGSITLAPEAGTQELRDAINKGVDEAQFEEAVAGDLRGRVHRPQAVLHDRPARRDRRRRRRDRPHGGDGRRAWRARWPRAARASRSPSRPTCPRRTRRSSTSRSPASETLRRRQQLLRDAMPRNVRVSFHDVAASRGRGRRWRAAGPGATAWSRRPGAAAPASTAGREQFRLDAWQKAADALGIDAGRARSRCADAAVGGVGRRRRRAGVPRRRTGALAAAESSRRTAATAPAAPAASAATASRWRCSR